MEKENRDDVALWVIITACIFIPVLFVSLWAFYDRYYPPMFIAVLLGIAVAALTYRYLGGASGSEFSFGVLKVAGSAALLLGTAYLTNWGLSKQMNQEIGPNKFAEAICERNTAQSERDQLKTEVGSLKGELEIAEKKKAEVLINEIEKLSPSSELGRRLSDLAIKKIGPFSEVISLKDVNVTVVGYVKDREVFYACENLGFGGEKVRLTRVDYSSDGSVRTLTCRQRGVIQATVCNEATRRFDIQIGCDAGLILFPEHISSCGSEGEVRWRVSNGPKIFKISAEVLSDWQ
ncbi:hypothetical protein SAMN05421830_10516 [Desulfomicrobium norvegicum]|uniref:Uncharacterized protein n=1 Tax=Desulfomicrobium norvegicum (strain DSM 1741 / NCIMB 8310) TaxID=52561 RepID=A0A8G2C2M1_DESNO|nr:hypothetical protein [Desulfomicrobium norvegicum]SFL69560.1 hypothetical protein SAMN05421830_10516 [Desulfomicrobium norvegicum]